MSSNLKVNTILPSTGTTIGIGTVGGLINVVGNIDVNSTSGISTFNGLEISGIVTAKAGAAVTYYGDGANLTGIDATKIITGNTQVQTIDTGSDGHIKFTTEGSERARILANGNIGIGEDAPVAKVHIAGSNYVSVGGGGFDSNVVLAITRNFTVGQSAGLALNSGTSATSFIHLGDADDPDIGKITYDHSNNSMSFTSNANERLLIDSSGNVTISTGNLTIPDSIIHSGDTDTKIAFTNNQIDLQCAGASRAYINNYALYVKSGFPLAFLASSGATPNIKSGGTNNQDLLFTTGSGNPTRLQITSAGSVLSSTSFVSKATADVNVTISTASGFTANTFVTVINHGVLEEESVYIISFKWNHGSSGQQPYFSHGAFVFNPSEVNTGSTGGQGPNYSPFQGHHMHTGVNRYWSFRYYGATGGTSVHGLQAAFDQTLNQSSGTLEIRATKIAKVTTI